MGFLRRGPRIVTNPIPSGFQEIANHFLGGIERVLFLQE